MYKALNGFLPQFLMDDCQLITTTSRRRLRSSSVATCDVPRTRTSLGDRSFTAASPRQWNGLPLHLRDSEPTHFQFRRLLKPHLFGRRSRRLVTYYRFSTLHKIIYLLIYLQRSADNIITMATTVMLVLWSMLKKFVTITYHIICSLLDRRRRP